MLFLADKLNALEQTRRKAHFKHDSRHFGKPKLYLRRWRIEENFRFKKQSFGIEKFRVLSLKSIRALHRIAMLAAAVVAILSAKRTEKALVPRLVTFAKPIFPPNVKEYLRLFLHYRIAAGIAWLLSKMALY